MSKPKEWKDYPKVTGDSAKQRAERGWCDRDTFSFDYYLCRVLAGYFNDKRNFPGWPVSFYYNGDIYVDNSFSGRAHKERDEEIGVIYYDTDKLQKLWRRTCKLMRNGFRAGAKMINGEGTLEEDEEWHALLQDALEHFKRNFLTLWN